MFYFNCKNNFIPSKDMLHHLKVATYLGYLWRNFISWSNVDRLSKSSTGANRHMLELVSVNVM